MKKYIIAIIFALCAFALVLGLDREKPQSEYKEQLDSTCKIIAAKTWRGAARGSGVLLDTGYILTNKHVVDADQNSTITLNERTISVELIGSTAQVYTGTVIFADIKSLNNPENLDLAVIQIENPPKSNIRLISDKEYSRIVYGEKLFAIGATLGEAPHCTTGIRSLDVEGDDRFHRTSAAIFYGSSGGGIYLSKTGQLVGITTRIKVYRGLIAPGWSEYIPATKIREFLNKNDLGFIVDKEKEDNTFLFWIGSICFVSLNFLFVSWMFRHALYR